MSLKPILSDFEALALCEACAESVYDTRAPSPEYAERVASLLFGTGAHESGGWHYARQLGFSHGDPRGAWGLWQCEAGSIAQSLAALHLRPGLAANCARYLFGPGADPDAWLARATHDDMELLRAIRDWPRLSCLFARLHYLRDPAPIPYTVGDQAHYYKRIYNTHLGRATEADFRDALRAHWPED